MKRQNERMLKALHQGPWPPPVEPRLAHGLYAGGPAACAALLRHPQLQIRPVFHHQTLGFAGNGRKIPYFPHCGGSQHNVGCAVDEGLDGDAGLRHARQEQALRGEARWVEPPRRARVAQVFLGTRPSGGRPIVKSEACPHGDVGEQGLLREVLRALAPELALGQHREEVLRGRPEVEAEVEGLERNGKRRAEVVPGPTSAPRGGGLRLPRLQVQPGALRPQSHHQKGWQVFLLLLLHFSGLLFFKRASPSGPLDALVPVIGCPKQSVQGTWDHPVRGPQQLERQVPALDPEAHGLPALPPPPQVGGAQQWQCPQSALQMT
mmetsp:Transcript_6685/g.24085  ORF Transcript_6685/g.24085 Transcript_6685/m.24085 type:complete len:321 (-) Transcript_6685:392-1354(-)